MAEDECDLEALLDVLDNEDDICEPEPSKENTDPSVEAPYPEEEDEEEMQRQLMEMEEKMRAMKERLKMKNKSAATAIGSSKISPVKAVDASSKRTDVATAVAASSKASAAGASSRKSEASEGSPPPTTAAVLAEIDVFSLPGSNIPGERCRGLTSPVKTQPLKEAERDVRLVKYEARATEWCPSRIKQQSTRLIQGEEADKLRAVLAIKDRKKMEEIARKDLEDSSDEERDADGDLIEQSDYARDMKKRIARAQSQHKAGNETPAASSDLVDRIKNIGTASGFIDKPGNKIQLTGKAEKKGLGFEKLMLEKHSGLRISRPTVTQQQLDQSMAGRRMINIYKMGESIIRKETEGDWVTMGVLYYKAPHKSNTSGNEFSVWKITDLRGDIKTLSLLLFGRAHKEHWKMPLNKVIGVLNPKLLEDRQQKGEISLSIDHPDKLLEIGESYDIGRCGYVKQDGNNCTNIVNKSVCEFCIYHVKRAYNSASSKRSALQSSFSGTGNTAAMTRDRIMQKIAPHSKGEVFAGGRVMNQPMVVGKTSSKAKARDDAMLAGLGPSVGRVSQLLAGEGSSQSRRKSLPAATSLLSEKQRAVVKSIAENVSEELGCRLLAPTPGARAILTTFAREEEQVKKSGPNPVVEKSAKDLLREHGQALARAEKPVLGWGLKSGASTISLDISPAQKSRTSASHARALAILQAKNSSITKQDPNAVFKSKLKNKTPETQKNIKKRLASDLSDSDSTLAAENGANTPNKRHKSDKSGGNDSSPSSRSHKVTVLGREMTREEYEALKGRKSSNAHLVAEAELAAADDYFDKMEKRDEMEAKMLSTFEMKTKAVTCHICNYTSFKASELCKSERHPFKVIDAVKRFFHCKNCKKRVVTLTRLPQESCQQCGSSSWVKAGMIAEKKGPKLDSEMLSIRGNEEKWLGGGTAGNINL